MPTSSRDSIGNDRDGVFRVMVVDEVTLSTAALAVVTGNRHSARPHASAMALLGISKRLLIVIGISLDSSLGSLYGGIHPRVFL